jgi:organic radical activating enzyme
MRYPVAEIFYSIQGEGRWVGRSMTFVRLAGCSVRACHIRRECDTDWRHGRSMALADIVARVRELPGQVVSITGGEPTDHALAPLLTALNGYEIHMETSGIRAAPAVQWLTVSPKTFDYIQRTGDALKVVVRPEWGWSELDRMSADSRFGCYYLQPLTVADEPVNLGQVLRMVQERPGWAVSVQAHRLWRVR